MTVGLKTKTITFNGAELKLSAMPLRKYAEFADELDGFLKGFHLVKPRKWVLFGKLSKLLPGESGEGGEMLEMVIYGLRNYPKKVARLLSIASGVSEEDILDADIEEVAALASEVWDLNNLVKVFSATLKKVQESIRSVTSTGA